MSKIVHEWKHRALLAALVALALLEPLAVHLHRVVAISIAGITLMIYLGVLMAIFESRWERLTALFMIAGAFLASMLHQFVPHPLQIWAIAYHCLAAVTLAFAVIVILQRIFRRRAIGTDDVIGALCGYLLAGVVWGNLYAMVYLIHPAAFQISDKIAAQLGNWQMQRFLFDYFSIMTMTTYGFGDIAPSGFPVYSLIWLESVFGQFYIAVVVAQLVGLRLAQAIKVRSGE